MFGRLRRQMMSARVAQLESSADKAGALFDGGYNCAQAVLQATTGRDDPELLVMAEAFGGGIGKSGCLCGAVTGGVMALGLLGQGKRNGELVEAFRREFKTTCCRSLSRDYQWLSREHKANCRRLTMKAAELVEQLVRR